MTKRTNGEIHTYYEIKLLRFVGLFARSIEIEAEGKVIKMRAGDKLTLTKHTRLGDD